MKATTKAKLFLKKYSPSWAFAAIRFVADRTILKLLPVLFSVQTKGFTKRMIKEVAFEKGRFSIVIDPKNGFHDAQVYALPLYEPHIVHEFVTAIKDGDVILDIGANIGHHAIIMAKLTGPHGKVHAYEPIPHIRDQMLESIALNHLSNIEVISDGLSDTPGTMKLHLQEGNIAGSSLVNENKLGEEIDITLRMLDSYGYEKIDFIKLDVEGFEYHVLKGGEETIARLHPTILFEWSPVYYRAQGNDHARMILEFLMKHNYSLIDLEDDRKPITDIKNFLSQFTEGMRSQTNILAS